MLVKAKYLSSKTIEKRDIIYNHYELWRKMVMDKKEYDRVENPLKKACVGV